MVDTPWNQNLFSFYIRVKKTICKKEQKCEDLAIHVNRENRKFETNVMTGFQYFR